MGNYIEFDPKIKIRFAPLKKTKENIKNRKKHLEYTQIKTKCFLWFLGFYRVFMSPRSGYNPFRVKKYIIT